jgi:hypothetical protein
VPVLLGVSLVMTLGMVLIVALPVSMMLFTGRRSINLAYLMMIPGVIILLVFYVRWFLATTVAVVERVGVFGSLRRSSQLGAGSRMRLFGLILVQYLIGMLVGWVVGLPDYDDADVSFFVTTLGGLVAASLTSIFPVVAYHELRLAREGIDLDQLASVFD